MRILVVEDESKTAAFLKAGLEEEGFTVDCAFDGEEGFQKALNGTYDLLILDIMLPKKDGRQLLRELRERGYVGLALFLTARDSMNERVLGLELGADSYMVKPFVFIELIAQVRSLLRRRPQSVQNLIRIADLEIDLAKQTAQRSGVKLALSAQEFRLLCLFATNRGQTLSRAMISETVWGMQADSDSNVIDVYIRRLRTKVDDPFEKKIIKTIRGIGYVMTDAID